jgi:hypothetical protein
LDYTAPEKASSVLIGVMRFCRMEREIHASGGKKPSHKISPAVS